jgi:hypothetical protein
MRTVCDNTERGIALITVMLIMSLMVMLALAVTFTALSDNAITSNFKNTTAGFYAAEAGVNNLHRLIRSKDFAIKGIPSPVKVTPGRPTINPNEFIPAIERLLETQERFPNYSAYRTKARITDVRLPFPADDTDPAHAKNRITYITRTNPRLGQIEPYSVSYSLESVGEGIAGLNGTVTLVEEGIINFKLLATANAGGLRTGSFAEFALYVNHFDPYRPEGPFIYQGFGPGDEFSGRVHTNERLGFWTGADGSDAPVFRGRVTQAYQDASYYRHGAGQPPAPVDADSAIVGGVVVAPKFLAGFSRGDDFIPEPENSYDQARAVLDGGFGLSAQPPSIEELRGALRAADQLSRPLNEIKDDGKGPEAGPAKPEPLKQGVYLPSDGESFTGSGLYIVGTVDDIVLSADAAGNRQRIEVRQGKQRTVIVFDSDTGTTTIDAGNGVRTLRGIPLDRTISTRGGRPAASIFVDGDVTSLRGPGRDLGGQSVAAIDTDFAVTVTAQGRATGDSRRPSSGGNITITGDLTYETPVTDGAGLPINERASNVLGIYASGGTIEIPMDGRAPDNLTVHASLASFELKDDSGNPVVGARGKSIGGRIRSDVSNWRQTPHRGTFTLVGGMQATHYDNFGVYDGRMHGWTYKGVWDGRFDSGHSPAWYPGYIVEATDVSGGSQVKAQTNSPVVLSYKRIYYGTIKE